MRGDLGNRHPGVAQQPAAPLRGRPDHHRPVTRDQLDRELRLPPAPHLAAGDGTSDQPRVVVCVTEDPRLATRLRRARLAALVQGHVEAALHERVRRRQADDAGADDCDVHERVRTSTRPGKRASRSSRRKEIQRVVPSARVRVTPASRSSLRW